MKSFRKTLCASLVLGLLVGPGVATVMALATSNSQATMNWPVSIAGNISWTSRETLSHAFAANNLTSDQDEVIVPGWGQTTNASAIVSMASGYAETTATRLYEEVWASCDGVTVSEAFADAGARRQGYFTASTSGYVTVTAWYSLGQSLTTELPGETAEGHSTAHLRLGNDAGWDVDVASLDNTVTDGQSFADSQNGSLAVQLWYNEGDIGFLEMEVFNIALAVPEPSSIMAMSVGLGMALLRRRQR